MYAFQGAGVMGAAACAGGDREPAGERRGEGAELIGLLDDESPVD
jgi:hypothetical protein